LSHLRQRNKDSYGSDPSSDLYNTFYTNTPKINNIIILATLAKNTDIILTNKNIGTAAKYLKYNLNLIDI